MRIRCSFDELLTHWNLANSIAQGWYDESGKVFHGTFQQYIVVPTHVVVKASGLHSCMGFHNDTRCLH